MERFYQLIFKKLTGEIEPFEEYELQQWVRESSDHELIYRRMLDAWHNGQYDLHIKGQKTTFKKISGKLDFEERLFHENVPSRPQEKWKVWYRVAVVFFFLAAAAGIFHLHSITSDTVQTVEQNKMVVKENPAGQKTRIHLPDGSVCWLNSESEIRFLSNFSDSTRNIYLKGEAYFEVFSNPVKPFHVHTSDMVVTALGTVFNVTSFPDDPKETVVLVEGKIAVDCMDKFFREVFPGEAVSYDKKSKISKKIKLEASEIIAWKDGILRFDDETYDMIFSKLQRWYGVKITVKGIVPKELKYRGSFKNELLVNILESIRYGHNFDFKIDGKNVTIMFNQKTQKTME